mgnify:CR=1 FL=1
MSFQFQILVLNVHRSKSETFFFSEILEKVKGVYIHFE